MPVGECLLCLFLAPFGVSNPLDDFPEKCHFGSFSWHVSPDDPKGFSEAPGPAPFFGEFEKVELVEKKVEKKKSTTVIHGAHSQRSFTNIQNISITVGTQRVAAVVARSALQ